MGTFVGHVLPGAGFLLLGLWHLVNSILSQARSPWHYSPRTWFPLRHSHRLRGLRHAELYFIMLGASLSIAAELFICPSAHQPWAEDWSIPANHLNNFEHSTISLFMFLYAALALATDATKLAAPQGWLHVLAAIALSQELLLFHFHSADHMGLEGHYHWLLQLPIAAAIAALAAEVFVRSLPVVAVVRSMALVFQGTWFIQMGMVLWTPALLPRECAMEDTPDKHTVRCATDAATHNAKAIVNLQFSWHLAAIVAFTAGLFFVFSATERRRMAYLHLGAEDQQRFKIADDADPMENAHGPSSPQHSIDVQAFDGLDLER